MIIKETQLLTVLCVPTGKGGHHQQFNYITKKWRAVILIAITLSESWWSAILLTYDFHIDGLATAHLHYITKKRHHF